MTSAYMNTRYAELCLTRLHNECIKHCADDAVSV